VNVPVRELKNRLSRYLRSVRQGRRVVVTDRGRPIAEIGPVNPKRLSPEARLTRLEETGELRRARGRLSDFAPVRIRGGPVAKTVVEDRD
jgi:prevent-host-death family protein